MSPFSNSTKPNNLSLLKSMDQNGFLKIGRVSSPFILVYIVNKLVNSVVNTERISNQNID